MPNNAVLENVFSFHNLVLQSAYMHPVKQVIVGSPQWGDIHPEAEILVSFNAESNNMSEFHELSMEEVKDPREFFTYAKQTPKLARMSRHMLQLLVQSIPSVYSTYDEFVFACPPTAVVFHSNWAQYESAFDCVRRYM